jgi:hypothetical protein
LADLLGSLRASSTDVDMFYVTEVEGTTDLEAILTTITGLQTRLTYVAMACFTSAGDKPSGEIRSAAGEFAQASVGVTAAGLLARFGAEVLEHWTVKDGQLYVLRVDGAGTAAASQAPDTRRNLLADVDAEFSRLYRETMAFTGTPDSGQKRHDRFYNLIKLLDSTDAVIGEIIECGCWRGLSSRLICLSLGRNHVFDGAGVTLCDSFEGLSKPSQEDARPTHIGDDPKTAGDATKPAGSYASSEQHLRTVLADFPAVAIKKGWIPDSLDALPDKRYRFVHLDLDLYEPIYGALRYFWPRLSVGGVILCDDYGSLFWPGARKAFDTFCSDNELKPILLSTGQAFLIKAAESGIAALR